jgi:hypothetical protein
MAEQPIHDLDRLIEDALSEMASTEDSVTSSSSPLSPMFSLRVLEDDLPQWTLPILVDVGSISSEEMSPISDISYLSSSPGHSSRAETGACPDTLTAAVCQVCGHIATRHLHYGTSACHSCRAFFRRAADKEKYKLFICKEGSNCEVRPKSWKSCKSCRFQKCLGAGMKVTWVLNDYQKTLRAKKSVAITNQFQSLPKVLEDKFTIDDFCLVKKLYINFQSCDIRVAMSSMDSWSPFMDDLQCGLPFSSDFFSLMENFCTVASIEYLSDTFNQEIAEVDRSVLSRQGCYSPIS